MHQPLQGTESGLLAYYRLDEGSGTNTLDATGNGYNGTLNGSPTWIPSGAILPSNQSVSVSTTKLLEGPGAGSDAVYLGTSSPGTPWTNSANATWLHLGTQSGAGSANIGFSFDANPGASRIGTLTIGGQTVTVTQAGVTYVQATQIGLLFSNLTGANGLAVDPSGNVYASFGQAVYKWSPGDASATQLISSGLVSPRCLALDSANNIYIANNGGNSVSKWMTVSSTLTTLFSGPNNPSYLALDFAGNVYFECSGVSNYVGPFKWSPVDGSITSAVPAAVKNPNDGYSGLAVDAGSDIFLGFLFTFGGVDGASVNEQPAGGTYTTVSANFEHPGSIAVDGVGTLYVSDVLLRTITKFSPPPRSMSTVASGVAPGTTTAVDTARNFYYSTSGIQELPYAFLDPSARAASADGGSDQLPVVLPLNANLTGAFSPRTDQPWLSIIGVTNAVVYYFVAPNTGSARTGNIFLLGKTIRVQQAAAVYSVGTTNLLEGPAAGNDSVVLYIDPPVATWTVTPNVAWLHPVQTNGAGSTNVVFAFDANGGATRTGTLTIAGQTLTIAQAGSTYAPAGVVTLVASGIYNPSGLAVDAAGNVYIADSGNKALQKWTVASQTLSTLISTGLNFPSAVAVDGNNNVYLTDTFRHVIEEWVATNQTVTNLITGLIEPFGVTVDAAGNLYICDLGGNAIKKWNAASGTITNLLLDHAPTGLSLDVAGNIYFSDGDNAIKETNAANGTVTTLVSASNVPSVAVDGSGNVFFVSADSNVMAKWSAASQTVTNLVTGLGFPQGVAVDAAGNVYFSDSGYNAVKELPRAFVDHTTRFEPATAGNDSLATVQPATANLSGVFYPASDQSWLTITGVTNGAVSYAFTANTGTGGRLAHIDLLGVSVTVNQAGQIPPPVLTGARMLANGAFQFSFTNNAAGAFTVITTPNVSLPLSQWTVAGVPTNVAPGVFQFTSGPATNGPRHFYSVRSP
jgi:sugar lactone lactonase YvrE